MRTRKSQKPKAFDAPTPAEMLEFMVKMANYPYKIWMSGPPTSRENGSEWAFSYGKSGDTPQPGEVHEGCVYASSALQVIAKAMRLFSAQERAARIIQEAKA